MTRNLLKAAAAAACLAASGAGAQTLLDEGFEDVSRLVTRGWIVFNGSDVPLGPGFGQGDATNFAAQAGTPNSFAFSGFAVNNTPTGDGAIYALLATPVIDLSMATQLTFWTRTVAGSNYPDRLSVGVDASDGTSGELLSINFSLIRRAYPSSWRQYAVDLGGLGQGVVGRFYFEYAIDDASVAGNYIGIDSVNVNVVPEPATWLMFGLGLAGLGALVRRRV